MRSAFNHKTKLGSLLVVAALMTLASCEKTIIVDLPSVPSRLSMISEISAGDSFQIQVGHTVSVKQNNGNVNMGVDNAVPLLYEDDVLVDTLRPLSQDAYIYRGKTTAVAGKTYRIDLRAPGYEMATASEAVPSTVPVQLESYRQRARHNSSGSDQDEVVIAFDDPAAPGDYYVLRIVNGEEQSIYEYGYNCLNTADLSAESGYSADAIDLNTCLPSNAVFFRDELFNGRRKEVKFFIDSGALIPNEDGQGNTIYPRLALIHVNQSYYRFLKSYFGSRESDGNPFAEPFNVTTNVNNGYGILNLMNSSEVEVKWVG